MYLDTKREGESSVFDSSTDHLIAWLERQPADKTYDYTLATECALAQWVSDGNKVQWHAPARKSSFDYMVNGTMVNTSRFAHLVGGHPQTFGGLLERVREAFAKGEV